MEFLTCDGREDKYKKISMRICGFVLHTGAQAVGFERNFDIQWLRKKLRYPDRLMKYRNLHRVSDRLFDRLFTGSAIDST